MSEREHMGGVFMAFGEEERKNIHGGRSLR